MKTLSEPLKNDWSYTHSFGVVGLGNENLTLVITDKKFWRGQSWEYNYFRLGMTFANGDEGKEYAIKLNKEYGLSSVGTDEKPVYFDTENSQNFLLEVQNKFPKAEINKITKATL